MLSQFTVKNYKSIRDEMTFDMQATAISEHEDRIIKQDGKLFLPVSAIYGPNGSGKSNVLEALHALTSKVLRPICVAYEKTECRYKIRKIPMEPFAFLRKQRMSPQNLRYFFVQKLQSIVIFYM